MNGSRENVEKWGMKKKIGLCQLNGYKKKIDHFALP
jgi:hypothetical protein